MWRGSSTPHAVTSPRLPLLAKGGSLAETAAWATDSQSARRSLAGYGFAVRASL